MPTPINVRDALVTVIESITNIGKVYPTNKYAADWAHFNDIFSVNIGGNKQIRGWWLSPPTVTGSSRGDTFDAHWRTYTFTVRGVQSYKDSLDTETTFTLNVYAVFDLISRQGTLGQPDVIDGSIEVRVPLIAFRMFGSTLCHYAEITVDVGVNDPVNWVRP